MTAQDILTQHYGNPQDPSFQSTWMVTWNVQKDFTWFPRKKIFIHKDFMIVLKKAFHELEAANLHKEIKVFDGCFNIRFVRGSKTVLSIHSWGCAIDLNAAENPLATSGKWTKAFIKTMTSCGVFCGQNWTGRKDPMHFALVNG